MPDRGIVRSRLAVLASLVAYALAMALVEAAIVIHLRRLYYPERPLEIFPLRLLTGSDLILETSREAATVVMIGVVAWLSQSHWPRRFAAFVLVFGVWDLGYYAWLKLFLDWPRHWLEWDLLFLIPWPWLGPWLAAALIALLFTGWGAWGLAGGHAPRWTRGRALLFGTGAAIGLVSFLAPAWPLLADSGTALPAWRPGDFLWSAFAAALAAMGAALGATLTRPRS